jgi:hypothetical protein
MALRKELDPRVAKVIEALADIMVDRDFAGAGALNDAHDPLRPLLKRTAERPVHH